MRKRGIVLLLCCLTLLTGCNYDPYAHQRPYDYGEATWCCDAYPIWFAVDPKSDDFHRPKGEIQIKDETYLCEFRFGHETNLLYIDIYPMSYADISDAYRNVIAQLYGECSFSEDSFTFTVKEITGSIFDSTVEEMTFVRTKSTAEA